MRSKNNRIPINRLHILAYACAFVGIVFLGRLFQLQVLQHSNYSQLAAQTQQKKFVIEADRGEIYVSDREEQIPLVLNETVYTVYADPNFIKNIDKTFEIIQPILELDEDTKNLLEKDSNYEVLARNVPLETAQKLRKANVSGIGSAASIRRVYPEGNLAAQVVGFVNNDGVGQYGVEQFLTDTLGGKDGLLNGVTDSKGLPIANEDTVVVRPEDGKDIVLSLERAVQQKAEQALKDGIDRTKAEKGSVLIMDTRNGKVRAMANYPTYDPAEYAKTEVIETFNNETVTHAYEPGSVIKIFSMATGLNEGAVTPDTTYQDNTCERIDGFSVCNVGENVNKIRSMTETITRSANTGVIFVLKQLGGGTINAEGKQKLYDYFTKTFKFGSKTGVEQTGESAGSVSPASSSSDVRYANMTFGQGVSMTMVQLASSLSAVVNGGTYYKPTVVAGTLEHGKFIKKDPKIVAENIISEQTSAQIRAMMTTVVDTGSGYAAQKSGYNVGGKTGTAEIANPQGGYFEDKFTGSFFGIPTENSPNYVIIVRVDDPKIAGYAGSAAAAPIFAEINNWLIEFDGIRPER